MITGFHASGKESACIAGEEGWIPGLGRYTEEGHDNALQYSCLENPWTEEPGRLVYGVVEDSDTT